MGDYYFTMFPVRCYTCSFPIGYYQRSYERLINGQHPITGEPIPRLTPEQALDRLNIIRPCCRINAISPAIIPFISDEDLTIYPPVSTSLPAALKSMQVSNLNVLPPLTTAINKPIIIPPKKSIVDIPKLTPFKPQIITKSNITPKISQQPQQLSQQPLQSYTTIQIKPQGKLPSLSNIPPPISKFP